jgi:hypothetical protein
MNFYVYIINYIMAVITYKVTKIINTIRRNYVMKGFRSFNNVTQIKKVNMIHNNMLNVANDYSKSVNSFYIDINNNNDGEINKLKDAYRQLNNIINDVIDDNSANSNINKKNINNFVSFIHNSDALNLYSKKLQDNGNDFTYSIDVYKEKNALFLIECKYLLQNILHLSNKNNYIRSALGINLINSLNISNQYNAERTLLVSDKMVKNITGNEKVQIIVANSFNDIKCKKVALEHTLLGYKEEDYTFCFTLTHSEYSYNKLGNYNKNNLFFMLNGKPQYFADLGALRNLDQINYCELNNNTLNAVKLRTLDKIVVKMTVYNQKQNTININKDISYDFSHNINRLVKFDNNIVLNGISSNHIANKFHEREKEEFNNYSLMDDVD